LEFQVASGENGQVTWQSVKRVNQEDETANVTSAVQHDVAIQVVDFVVHPGSEVHHGVAIHPALSLCIAAGCSPNFTISIFFFLIKLNSGRNYYYFFVFWMGYE
jgi:hypothetical protein